MQRFSYIIKLQLVIVLALRGKLLLHDSNNFRFFGLHCQDTVRSFEETDNANPQMHTTLFSIFCHIEKLQSILSGLFTRKNDIQKV